MMVSQTSTMSSVKGVSKPVDSDPSADQRAAQQGLLNTQEVDPEQYRSAVCEQ